MARYTTLKLDEADAELASTPNLEAVIVDGNLVAIIAGTLRIRADKGNLLISKEDVKL